MYPQNKTPEEKITELQKDYDALKRYVDENIGAAAQKIRMLEQQIFKLEKRLPPAPPKA